MTISHVEGIRTTCNTYRDVRPRTGSFLFEARVICDQDTGEVISVNVKEIYPRLDTRGINLHRITRVGALRDFLTELLEELNGHVDKEAKS
jgi:hypothetical protein